jgi:osmotically-inducible protein OsmY
MKLKCKNRLCACLLVAPAIALTGAVSGCALTRDDDVRTAGEYIDDRTLINRVEDALEDDPTYKFYEVQVTSFQGTVQLSGFVTTDQQKARAEAVAGGVPGVERVENKITVRNPEVGGL